MAFIRRRLRLAVTAWLVVQVALLSALVPRDCCAAHQAASQNERSCHEEKPAEYCPMRGADGTPCPMHRGGRAGPDEHAADHNPSDREPASQCSIRGTCSGPGAALFALLSNHGVLPDAFEVFPDFDAHATGIRADASLIGRLASPDPPPPRS